MSHSIPGPVPTYFLFLAFIIFQQVLSDKSLHCHSTGCSSSKLLYLFSTLSSLAKKNDHKRSFDITFIIAHLLARNHATKEVNLSIKNADALHYLISTGRGY